MRERQRETETETETEKERENTGGFEEGENSVKRRERTSKNGVRDRFLATQLHLIHTKSWTVISLKHSRRIYDFTYIFVRLHYSRQTFIS